MLLYFSLDKHRKLHRPLHTIFQDSRTFSETLYVLCEMKLLMNKFWQS